MAELTKEALGQLEDTVSRYPMGLTDNCIVKELLAMYCIVKELLAMYRALQVPFTPAHNCSGCVSWNVDPQNPRADWQMCRRATMDAMRYMMCHRDFLCKAWTARDV